MTDYEAVVQDLRLHERNGMAQAECLRAAAEARIAAFYEFMDEVIDSGNYVILVQDAAHALRGPAEPAAEGPFDQLKAAFDVVRREHAYPAEPADD